MVTKNSSDEPSNADLQIHEELRLFEVFVEHAGLSVTPGSIEARSPPEPDILCEVLGEKVAFELGELSDEDFRQGFGTMMKSGPLLYQSLEDLPEPARTEFKQRYADSFVSVQFEPGASLRRRLTTVTMLYDWMSKDAPLTGEIENGALPSRLRGVIAKVVIDRPRHGLRLEPGFATFVGLPSLRIVEKKVKAKYSTEHPIELLLHMAYPVLPPSVWIEKNGQLLRDKVSGSVFRRVWLFSAPQRTTEQAVTILYP